MKWRAWRWLKEVLAAVVGIALVLGLTVLIAWLVAVLAFGARLT